jgi:phosphatidylserine/phosphatidylglycerophosphate/cardiolipin synthase-like enzyme
MRYRPVYVHAKLAIVDDRWWTVGSANLNSRGMHADAEINVSALDPTGAETLRLRLWQEHAHPQVEDIPSLNDPVAGLKVMRSRARENFERVRKGKPLVGISSRTSPIMRRAHGISRTIASMAGSTIWKAALARYPNAIWRVISSPGVIDG